MEAFTKIILTIIMLSIITSSSVEEEGIDKEVLANNPQIIELLKDETKILLKNADKANTQVFIDLVFTHPSNYNCSFYQSSIDSEEGKNDTEIDGLYSVYSDVEPLFVKNVENGNKQYPLRKLETLDNFTVTEKEEKLGKKRIILGLEKLVKSPVILSVLRKEEKDGEKMYINYHIGEEELELNDTKVDFKQNKDMLNITFKGLKTKNDEALENITVSYTINLFDREQLESKYENIYAYKIDSQVKSLYSENIKLKGNNVTNEIFLVVKAPLNDKKEQLLLVDAEITKGEENLYLQFESKILKVEEQSPERVWPSEDDKKDEDLKKKNKNKLYIIMICFAISVLLTLLILFIYIKFFASKDGNIEEEKDYKDVGGIVINDDGEKHDGPATKAGDGKKINEEEE